MITLVSKFAQAVDDAGASVEAVLPEICVPNSGPGIGGKFS